MSASIGVHYCWLPSMITLVLTIVLLFIFNNEN